LPGFCTSSALLQLDSGHQKVAIESEK